VSHLIVKSKKQHIRLWFEFLKLSRIHSEYQEDETFSLNFYAPWGEIEDLKFDDWWPNHEHLFSLSETQVITKVKNRAGVLNVAIPLNQSISKSIEQLREIIRDQQHQLLLDQGVDPNSRKTTKVHLGVYETTPGVELRGRSIHEDLVMFQIWLSLGKPAINTSTIHAIRNTLKQRPKAKWIPSIIADEDPLDSSNMVRQLRRRLKRAEKICFSVSKGQFPGKNTI